MNFNNSFSDLVRLRLKPSVIGRMRQIAATKKDIISFAAGEPSVDLFPVKEIKEAFNMAIDNDVWSLNYPPVGGYKPLKLTLIKFLKKHEIIDNNISLDEDNVLLTNGSQAGITYINHLFLNPKDTVAVEKPTYSGALGPLKLAGANFLSVETDENGPIPESLEEQLKSGKRIKFFYTIPNFQNPAGISTSFERRKKIIELAEKYDFFVVEDDPYRFITFREIPKSSYFSINPERGILLFSISKTISPGLRGGFIIAHKTLTQKLMQIQTNLEVGTPTIIQHALYYILKNIDFKSLTKTLQQAYKQKKDLLIEALQKHLRNYLNFNDPDGGLFVWAKSQLIKDSMEFAMFAIDKYEVSVVPGTGFFANPEDGKNYIRLSFTEVKPDTCEKGIIRLKKAIEEFSQL